MILRSHKLSVFTPDMKHKLVNEVSIELQAGQITAIIGANGAGKSSLLKALAGDLPYTGTITTPLFSSQAMLRARQVAVLPQFSLLNFPYKVHQVVALGRIPHATGYSIDRQIISQALQIMDVDYLHDRNYMACSGGEKQRIQIARVLAQIWRAEDSEHQARLLLLDEPNTALDLGHQRQLMMAVKQFAEQGVAVCMVSHDVNLAAQFADQLLALLCSEVLSLGSPSDVVQTAVLSKLFNTDIDIVAHPETGRPIVVNTMQT